MVGNFKVGSVIFWFYVFKYVNGDDVVKVVVQIVIILEMNFYIEIGVMCLGYFLLFGGDGYIYDVDLIILCYIFGEIVLFIVNIQYLYVWFQFQFVVDEIQFSLLGGFEVLCFFLVIVGILYIGIKYLVEEIVVEVVVFFIDNSGMFFILQIKQMSVCDVECVFEMVWELFF